MSVLSNMRNMTESGSMKVVLGIVVLVFVFWGIGNQNSPTSTVLVEINGVRVTDTTYQKRMRDVVRSRRGSLSQEEQDALGNQVLNSLILEEIMRQEADRLGLQVSGEEIARAILHYDIFKDEDGKFSPELYERYLKRYGTRKGTFEVEMRDEMVRDKLLTLSMFAVDVDDDQVRDYWKASNTTMDLDFVRISPMVFYDDIQPQQSELDAFIAEFGPEISARYKELFESRYHFPPRASVRTILLRNDLGGSDDKSLKALMDDIIGQIDGGQDFSVLARKYSEHPTAAFGGRLGQVVRDQLAPEVAASIFGQEDQPIDNTGLREPVQTEAGLQLIYVDEILPEKTITEDEARHDLAVGMLKEKRAPELASAFAQDLLAAWKAAGDPPMEKLESQGLKLNAVDSITLADQEIGQLRDVPQVLEDLETAVAGQVLDKVYHSGDAWFVVRLKEKLEPNPSEFETERAAIEAQLLVMEQASFIQDWRDDLVARAHIERRVNL